MAWDESKHPRDDLGRFTNGTGAPRTFRQNASYGEILNSSATREDRISRVTKKQWAMWYEAIGNIKRGMWCPSCSMGKLVLIDSKIFITDGSYANPVLVDVLEYDSTDTAIYYIERMKEDD